MVLQVGDPVGDFPLVRMDRTVAHLSDFKDPVLVLIFLRHLA
jgi:peroxiredoxin